MAGKVGASLRLQALANSVIAAYAVGGEGDEASRSQLSVEVAAMQLFTLTAKSLEPGTGFALVNARQIVRNHHEAAMDRLKAAAAAEAAGVSPGRFSTAAVQEQAQRLKQATRLCGLLKLGEEALAAYGAATRRRGRAATPDGSSPDRRPRKSPSPSPGRRGKRKTPERPAAGRSRFGLWHGGANGGAAAAEGDEPPCRRRSSSGGQEGSAVLQPKQLFACADNIGSSGGAGGAGESCAGGCAEWAAFKAFMASPRKPATPASPAVGTAQQQAQQDAQQAQQDAQQQQQDQQAEAMDAMDVDLLCLAAQQCELGSGGGRSTPLSPSCQKQLQQQQEQAEQGPQVQMTPVKQMCSLLQLSPVGQSSAGGEAPAEGSHATSVAPRPAGRSLLLRHAGPASQRAAVAAEIIAADVMMLLREDSGGLQGADSSMADCDVGGSIGEAFVDPQHDVPLPRPAPHPQQRQPGGGPPSAPASGARLLWVGGVRVLSCPAVAQQNGSDRLSMGKSD
ncbi:hypothetical protein C2E20_0854 isoform B [Micractinium conductrix]|uniref:Uncharacterized protein n=1 Tax=Micractinium conductrix TaxID=554055 RepID=A0A2P6VQM0_9CHLO|nr:hypothetical protein C2E20_0854 isoform B [Micractinium conductrix]|eukprot:PSC76365.1 hypothetical protein C2E20_0854 isoform B [Micractinium conductrix]